MDPSMLPQMPMMGGPPPMMMGPQMGGPPPMMMGGEPPMMDMQMMGMGEPPMDELTGPMAAPPPVMEAGGDSIAALLEFVDDPDVIELLRKQEAERQDLLDALDEVDAAASRALMDRLALMGESMDMGGGSIGGLA